MSPGQKQTLAIVGFGALLVGLIWWRNQPQTVVENGSKPDDISFPVPATVSPAVSPLFAGVYTAPPTAAQTYRLNAPLPIQDLLAAPRDNSSADNAGCCDKCGGVSQSNNYPILAPSAVQTPTPSRNSPSFPIDMTPQGPSIAPALSSVYTGPYDINDSYAQLNDRSAFARDTFAKIGSFKGFYN